MYVYIALYNTKYIYIIIQYLYNNTIYSPPYTPYTGLMYLKVKMDPDVADAIESVEGVIRFERTQNTKLVMPLPVKQGENLEAIRSNTIRDLPLETKKMKKNDYVSVISGIHEGRYGILSASKAGLFEV